MDVHLVQTTIEIHKPKVKVLPVYWPTLSLRSWVSILAESHPIYLLGGFRLEQEVEWRKLFTWFWNVYEEVDPTHPIYSTAIDRSAAVPIMAHGDEGRGLRSQAFMVLSWQCVISHLGPFTTNTSGQLGTS